MPGEAFLSFLYVLPQCDNIQRAVIWRAIPIETAIGRHRFIL
jgi:hypothetical protein